MDLKKILKFIYFILFEDLDQLMNTIKKSSKTKKFIKMTNHSDFPVNSRE